MAIPKGIPPIDDKEKESLAKKNKKITEEQPPKKRLIGIIVLAILILGLIGLAVYYFGFFKNKPQEETSSLVSSSVAYSAPAATSINKVTSVAEPSLYEQYKVFVTIKEDMTNEEILKEVERIYSLPEGVLLDPDTLMPIDENSGSSSAAAPVTSSSSAAPTASSKTPTPANNGGALPPGFDTAVPGEGSGGERPSRDDMGTGEKVGY